MRRHIAALDGVRGVAVLIVIIHNTGWIAGSSDQLIVKLFSAVAATGWIGVSLFFALSGFLITQILLDTRLQRSYFVSFYVRRTLRIFPLYFAYVAVVVFMAAPLAWSATWAADVRAGQWPYWLYVSNWTEPFGLGVFGMTHLWSLAVEEQFYLVWPMIVYAGGARGVARLSIALALSGPVIRWMLALADVPDSAAYYFTIARWDALAAGSLLATMIREAEGPALLTKLRLPLLLASGLSLCAMVVAQRGFQWDSVPVAIVGQSLVVALCFCVLAYCVTPRGDDAREPLPRLLRARWMRMLGKYSYAMYVLHWPIHYLLQDRFRPWVTASDDATRIVRILAYVALVFGLSLLAALVSWLVIERHFMRLKSRWAPTGVLT